MKRKIFVFSLLLACCTITLNSCVTDSVTSIEDIPTTQAFLKDSIPAIDLERIVKAGVNAPSGLNRQPWHFTVISDMEIIQKLAAKQKEAMKNFKMPKDSTAKAPVKKGPHSALGDSPAVIVISCMEGNEFDAGLACECMNDVAVSLGYGTKIVGSITMVLNGENKSEYYRQLGIPDGQKAVAAILIGKTDKAYDATTSATPRNPFDEIVTFIK